MNQTRFSPERVRDLVQAANPWWEKGRVEGRYAALPERPFKQIVSKTFEQVGDRRFLVLKGQRRVGKTVIVHQLIADLLKAGVAPAQICYLALDSPVLKGYLLYELVQLFRPAERENTFYLFCDEVQYFDDWAIHLKSIYDLGQNIRAVVTGSAAAVLARKVSDSGAGRFRDIYVPPLTFGEFLFLSQNALYHQIKANDFHLQSADHALLNRHFIDYINYGSYPEVIDSQTKENFSFDVGRDVMEKVLHSDLPSLYGIENTQELAALFSQIAFETGFETSYENLSNRTQIHKDTLRKYIEYLEAAYLIRKIQRVDDNARNYQRNVNIKLYVTSTSIRTALAGPVADGHPHMGHLAETALLSCISPQATSVHYARWKDEEVDFVLYSKLFEITDVIEVKWSDGAIDKKNEFTGLEKFIAKNKLDKHVYITSKTKVGQLRLAGIDVPVVPTWYLALVFSNVYFQAEQAFSHNLRLIEDIEQKMRGLSDST